MRRLLHHLLLFATGFPFCVSAPLHRRHQIVGGLRCSGEGQYYIAFLELVKLFSLRCFVKMGAC
jgi:hypothetical protein